MECVCVCVWKKERERESGNKKGGGKWQDGCIRRGLPLLHKQWRRALQPESEVTE